MTIEAKLSTSKAVKGSRIRREPPPPPRKLNPPASREREITLAVIGVVLFALAITTITIGFSAITGEKPPPPAAQQQTSAPDRALADPNEQ